VSKAGVANGLYRGQAVTLLREAQAYGVWFMTYEYLMNWDIQRRGLKDRSQVEAWRLALYGGLAGETLWLSSYPFDVIKSKMQTDGLGAAAVKTPLEVGGKPAAVAAANAAVNDGVKEAAKEQFERQRYKNMRDCVAQTYREQGIRGFWKGLGPTLFRAMPVSAATFFT
jgi:solute carrier family 25 carnitine/acylcarnitine transporter 20/29